MLCPNFCLSSNNQNIKSLLFLLIYSLMSICLVPELAFGSNKFRILFLCLEKLLNYLIWFLLPLLSLFLFPSPTQLFFQAKFCLPPAAPLYSLQVEFKSFCASTSLSLVSPVSKTQSWFCRKGKFGRSSNQVLFKFQLSVIYVWSGNSWRSQPLLRFTVNSGPFGTNLILILYLSLNILVC